MNRDGLRQVLKDTSFKIGLPIEAVGSFSKLDQAIKFRAAGLNDLETFHFVAQRSPTNWVLELKFDLFSKPLLNWLRTRPSAVWQSLKEQISDFSEKAVLVQSNLEYFTKIPNNNAGSSDALELILISQPTVDWNTQSLDDEIEILSNILANAFLLLDLLLRDEQNIPIDAYVPEIEGFKEVIACSKYSRSPKNRKKCLDYFGYNCFVCGLNPETSYGPEGKYIIHVHHTTPVSKMEEPKALDFKLDLVPLCPNCHNFIHKFKPPMPVEEAKTLFLS